jgi:hypothetical protein
MTELWHRDPGRVVGLFYLIMTILVFVGALRFIIVPDGAVTPVTILIARIAIVADQIHLIFFLLLALALYIVFSPFSKNLALVILLSISISVTIQSMNTLNYYAALSLLSGPDFMFVFNADQVQALAAFYLDLHMSTTHIAEFFWFLWLFAAGYLVFKSEILHRYLGILLMVGGIGYLLVILVFFVFPSLGIVSTIGAVFAGLAEMSLMVWLLAKGVKRPE